MATLAQIRTKVDNWLTARWPTLVNLQETYFTNHGRYFQGLITHTTEPADDIDSPPNRLLVKPTDQIEHWGDFTTLPATMPAALVIDVYNGPHGSGWQATVFVRVLDNVYMRTQQVGAETWRNSTWRQVGN